MRLAPALVLLSGCAFAPEEGTWNTYPDPLRDDTCELSETDPEEDTFVLVNNDDGTFTTTNDDIVHDCTLDKKDFSCDAVLVSETDLTGDGIDAVLQGMADAVGAFSDKVTSSGATTVNIDCEGTDCSLVESMQSVTFPCSFAWDWTADLAE